LQTLDDGRFAYKLSHAHVEQIEKVQRDMLRELKDFMDKVEAAFDFVKQIDSIKDPKWFIQRLRQD
jgi:hypothetical protein